MAVSNNPQGYQCEFIDTVNDDFYCKKCSLVARKLTFTSCCGESYCQACIADTQQQAKPCPACGQQNFTTLQQIKYQQRMAELKVYCSMKGRGCGWSGTLKQLDTHLEPDLDNCKYVDTTCPLNCNHTIPKNKLDQHMAKECVKRYYVCQYCAFKATYEEVVDTHWPECLQFSLQCPNSCGLTCERNGMVEHLKMCPLEEVACEYTGVGCDGKFRRKNQGEHIRQNTERHLSLTAAATVQMNQQLLHKLQEMEQRFLKLLQEKSNQNEVALINVKRTFAMKNFSKEKAKDKAGSWKSPAMYTHMYGYKFCVGIDANGYGTGRRKAMDVYLGAMQGDYDHQLKWPIQASFTIELIHKQGENVKHTITREWEKPKLPYICIGWFGRIRNGIFQHFLEHSKLEGFLCDDTLYFHVSSITFN